MPNERSTPFGAGRKFRSRDIQNYSLGWGRRPEAVVGKITRGNIHNYCRRGWKERSGRVMKMTISPDLLAHRRYLPLISTFTSGRAERRSRARPRPASSSSAWIFIPFPECIEFQTKSTRVVAEGDGDESRAAGGRTYDRTEGRLCFHLLAARIKRIACFASQLGHRALA